MAWKRKSLSSLLSLAKHFIWWMNRFWTHQFSKPEAFMSEVILQTQWTPDDFIWRETETRSQWNQAKKTTPLKKNTLLLLVNSSFSFLQWEPRWKGTESRRDGWALETMRHVWDKRRAGLISAPIELLRDVTFFFFLLFFNHEGRKCKF